ncbi:MAG: hypothetical protein OXG35_10805, partial [Acidobacteria bacterium]|nr:hypothetical protein [Acidobacteriota bacterium]
PAVCDRLADTAIERCNDGMLSALAAVAERVPIPTEPFRPKCRGSLPRVDETTTTEATRLQHTSPWLPGLEQVPQPSELEQLDLPGFQSPVEERPSWLLWLYDNAHKESDRSPGRVAPWDLRLFVGALLHLSIRSRDGLWRTLRFPTEEVIGWLHPGGWANRRRDWDSFPTALRRVNSLYLQTEIGMVLAVVASVIPRQPTDPLVEFSVRLPKSSSGGVRIDWRRLTRYGATSATLYRAYLSVCAARARTA